MKCPPGTCTTSYDDVKQVRAFSNTRGAIMSCTPANATDGTLIRFRHKPNGSFLGQGLVKIAGIFHQLSEIEVGHFGGASARLRFGNRE